MGTLSSPLSAKKLSDEPPSPQCSLFLPGPRRSQHGRGRCQPSGLINPEFVHNVYCFNQLRQPRLALAFASLMPTHQDSPLFLLSLLSSWTQAAPQMSGSGSRLLSCPLGLAGQGWGALVPLFRPPRSCHSRFFGFCPFSMPPPQAMSWIWDEPLPVGPRLAFLSFSSPTSCPFLAAGEPLVLSQLGPWFFLRNQVLSFGQWIFFFASWPPWSSELQARESLGS